ncbi:hypothetical protein K435DRAFT_646105 [Dendrothele bispora CBS 962.96]|uniref:Uncharacterized protein n=1 Tax=Dendrothele bispora (strain CBS 962.96) TaxID=1314807 RepID=A0A4S8MTI7_DENBC|nr:hypothetical protein K435DRAFT_646105 [Dendrothele bispora CBS 962.96]
MSTLRPVPTTTRGDVILDPAFFTSSLFVHPFRDDIWSLVQLYHEAFLKIPQDTSPFTVFKTVWRAQGWDYMHFKALDATSRETFLNVCFRLFLERTVKTEAPFTRVVALFGLYTFFNTQPSGSAPPLLDVRHIPIPLDHYASLLSLPTCLVSEQLLPLKNAASHILANLVESKVFHIIPNSDRGAQNPRFLPRELCPDSNDASTSAIGKRGPGRPTRKDSAKRSKHALLGVEDWMKKTSEMSSDQHYLLTQPPRETLVAYRRDKSNLVDVIGDTGDVGASGGVIGRASLEVLERLKQAQALMAGQEELIERAERAAKTSSGLLGLTEGAGNIDT